MRNISTFREEHKEIVEMVEEIRPMLNEKDLAIKPLAKTAHDVLCEIVKKIADHVEGEDRELYPSLLVSNDPKIKSVAWGFKSGEQSLRRGLVDYQKKWLKNCDFQFTKEFIDDTMSLFEMLATRVEQEEKILFPRLQKAGIGAEAIAD